MSALMSASFTPSVAQSDVGKEACRKGAGRRIRQEKAEPDQAPAQGAHTEEIQANPLYSTGLSQEDGACARAGVRLRIRRGPASPQYDEKRQGNEGEPWQAREAEAGAQPRASAHGLESIADSHRRSDEQNGRHGNCRARSVYVPTMPELRMHRQAQSSNSGAVQLR